MSGKCELSFQHRSLVQQGYESFSIQQLKEIEWGLRFTPFVCAMITLYGLATQQPWVLFTVALLGVWAFLFPATHPMDMLYNHVIRHAFGAVKLPPNPFQRRLACLSAAGMNTAAALLFVAGLPTVALVIGGCLLFLQAIVIATHFCALSWIYEGVARMLGKWHPPLESTAAQQLLRQGARVVDVRSPQEFATGHLDGAVNLPLETLADHLDELPTGTILLHCKSGIRSNMAAQLLKKHGFQAVHNLGSLSRAKQIVEACEQQQVEADAKQASRTVAV